MSDESTETSLGTRQSPAGGVSTVEAPLVLLVDDEETVRAVTAVLLKRHGWIVAEAADGAEALARYLVAPASYALLVVDLSMPRVDGVAFIRAVRARSPAQPIVVMSGHDRRDASRLMEGLTDIVLLQKPFSAPRLLAAVRDAVGGSSPA